MHAIAHGGVQTHVRESALKVDSGRKKNSLLQRGIEPAIAVVVVVVFNVYCASLNDIFCACVQRAELWYILELRA